MDAVTISNMSQVFEPNLAQIEKMPNFSQNNVPHFLFRIHSSNSAGSADATDAGSWVSFRASGTDEADKAEDIFGLPRHIAAARLNAHMQWQYWNNPQSNLVSWTASLLYAIQFGLYKFMTSGENVKLSQIYLLALDTKGFTPGTFVQDLELLEVFYRHERYADQVKNLENLRAYRENSNNYPGEYFTQGRLHVRGRRVQTSLQDLIDHGLFDLNDALKEKDGWLDPLTTLESLREPFRQDDLVQMTSEPEIRTAVVIAKSCFGGEWTIPMTLMLLSLRPRGSSHDTLKGACEVLFKGKYRRTPD